MASPAPAPAGIALPRAPEPTSSPRRYAHTLMLAAALVVAVVFVYAPAIRGGWLWDDNTEYTANLELRDPAGWWRAWVSPAGPDYFPVKTTVQWLEWHAWSDRSTVGYHVVTLALHLGAALLYARVLRRLGLRFAWAAAALFALHPLAVESVAWLAELKNTLSAVLLLAAFDAWLDLREHRGTTAAVRTVAFFGAAMLSKSTVAPFPVFLGLLEWLRPAQTEGVVPAGSRRRARIVGGLLLALSLALGAVTLWFQSQHAIAGWTLPHRTLLTRTSDAALALGFYVGKCLWPAPLSPIYAPFSPREVLLAAAGFIGLAGVMIAAWRARHRWGAAVLLGAGWFVLFLLPVVGIVDMSYLHLGRVADHFAYLALFGYTALVAAAAAAVSDLLSPRRRPWALLALGSAGAVLGLTARAHAGHFREAVALWTHAVRVSPSAWVAHSNLGAAQLERDNWPAALAALRQAIDLEPADAPTHLNLGTVWQRLQRREEALAEFRTAVKLEPAWADAHVNLANALSEAGALREAVAEYQTALRLSPREPLDAQYNLGNALLRLGEPAAAAAAYRTVLKLKPAFVEAQVNLGNALAVAGDFPAATIAFERAAALRPGDAAIALSLADALTAAGRAAEAVPRYAALVRSDPGNPELHARFGDALLALDRRFEALEQYEAALRSDPGNPAALAGLRRAHR